MQVKKFRMWLDGLSKFLTIQNLQVFLYKFCFLNPNSHETHIKFSWTLDWSYYSLPYLLNYPLNAKVLTISIKLLTS